MYAGKTQAKLNQEKLKKKREAAKVEIQKNVIMVCEIDMQIKEIYSRFQTNLNEFAKKYKN